VTPELEALFTDFLDDGGCPCRYPRFRSTVRRDTTCACGGSFTTAEQRDLIYLYEHRLELRDKQDAPHGWEAFCVRCGSAARFSANEFSPGAWIEYLVVTRAAGVRDRGAPAGNLVYRTGAWISPGPAMAGQQLATKAFPLMPLDEWLAWMREERSPA
jgi:hypothetical protein